MLYRQDRKTLIAKVHIAKSQLGMEEADYRALLLRVTGISSSKEMDEKQLVKVLDEMKQLGFKGAPGKSVKASAKKDDPQARKIRAMWVTLHQLGEVKDGSEEALRRFCKRTGGIDHLDWLDATSADKIIKALRGWISRSGGDPNGF